jgi:hypothetical protein
MFEMGDPMSSWVCVCAYLDSKTCGLFCGPQSSSHSDCTPGGTFGLWVDLDLHDTIFADAMDREGRRVGADVYPDWDICGRDRDWHVPFYKRAVTQR